MSVYAFPTGTISPEAVLEMSKRWGADEILVVGRMPDGTLKMGGTSDDLKDVSWLLTLAQNHVLTVLL